MQGKPYAGNPHVWFDEGAGAPKRSGRSALLYGYGQKRLFGWMLAAVLLAGMLPHVSVGANTAWKGGDGSWDDPAMWTKGVPGEGDTVYFPDGTGGRVTLNGTCLCAQVLIGTQNVVSEEDAPVVFCGGGTLTQGEVNGNIWNVYPGRTMIIDNATVSTGSNGLILRMVGGVGSTAIVRSGGILDNSNARTTVETGSVLTIDGGEAHGNLTLSGTLRMTAGLYRFTEKSPTIADSSKIDITGGTIIYGDEMRNGQVFTSDAVDLFPRCADASLVVSVPTANDKFPVNLDGVADGAVYRLAGTVSLTNYVTDANLGTFASTSNMVFYGGGTLAANWICQRKGDDFDFGLSRVLLASGLRSGSSFSSYRFHGDVMFGAWGDWRMNASDKSVLLPDGDVTFDTADCFDPLAAAHRIVTPVIRFENGSIGISFVGEGDVECRFNRVQLAPYTIRSLQFADGMDVTFSDSAAAAPSYYVRDFLAGENTRFTIPVKCVNSLSNVNFTCLSKSVLPESAQFTAIYENRSAVEGTFYNVFTAAPGGDWPDPTKWTLVRADADSGTESDWEMRVVGPTVYLRDGNRTPYSGNSHWIGAMDGNLSTDENWSNGDASANNSLWFTGERNTIVTNDHASLTIKGIRVSDDAGPFVIRGNKLTVNRSTGFGNSSATVYHGGAFPLVIECDLTMTGNINAWVSVDSAGYVAFMGDVAMGARTLNMRGEMLVGNTFAVGDLALWNKPSNARATVFHVVEKGDATISGQVSAFTNTACLSVCGGGKLRFTGGVFRYAKETNTHLVDGLLDIAVPFGCGAADAGTAASDIGFEGTGVVKIASVKSSALGNSTVKLNGKVNLVPPAAGWTTVTADSPGTALTLALPEWGRATLAPTDDFVYGPAEGVTPSTLAADRAFACGRFSELTVKSDHAVTFADPLVFEPYSTLVKKGTGQLAFTTGNDVFPETLKVEGGTFAWSVPVAVTNLKVAAGAKLAFAAVNGTVHPITVAEDVSIDGAEIAPIDSATRLAMRRGTTILEVPAHRKITGTPVTGPSIRTALVATASGGMAVKVSPILGTQMILR